MNLLTKIFTKFIVKDRKKLFDRVCTLIDFSKSSSLLDIGGPTIGSKEIYKQFNRIVILNLDSYYLHGKIKQIEMLQADACNLPFRDDSFDYILSNATLEHIPKQKWFNVSHEIFRVAIRNFFIITPNYYFPLEPHSMIPLFQFLPRFIKHFFLFRLNMKFGYVSKHFYKIYLPEKRQLENIFKSANIHGRGILIPRNWIITKNTDI